MTSRSAYYGNQNDPSMTIAAMAGGFVLLLAIIWFQSHTYLSWAAIKIAFGSVSMLEGIIGILEYLGLPSQIITFLFPPDVIANIEDLKFNLIREDPSQVNFKRFVELIEISAYVFRLFIPLLMLFGIVYVIKRSKAARLTRKMDIFSLAKLSMNEFPQIRPAVIEDLFKVDPDSGPFRRESGPIRFAIQNELLVAYESDFTGQLLKESKTPTFDTKKSKDPSYEVYKNHLKKSISKLHNRCVLDIKKTENRFIEQLGPLWKGNESLPPFTRALYAALISFVCADKKTAFKLLEQFNRTWKPPKKKQVAEMDLSGVDEAISKYENREEIQELFEKHAYVTTLMSRLLREARSKGRLGSAHFLWLKVIDRELWYALSQEGGQTGWTEAAGVRAHLLAEVSVGSAIHFPYVATAVDEYEKYLSESEGWIPLPEDLPKD